MVSSNITTGITLGATAGALLGGVVGSVTGMHEAARKNKQYWAGNWTVFTQNVKDTLIGLAIGAVIGGLGGVVADKTGTTLSLRAPQPVVQYQYQQPRGIY